MSKNDSSPPVLSVCFAPHFHLWISRIRKTSSVGRQKGLTTSHLQTLLDPFASKLTALADFGRVEMQCELASLETQHFLCHICGVMYFSIWF